MDSDNSTSYPGDGTGPHEASSSAGLAVGLTLFFLLLGIAVALLVYKQRSKLRNMLQLEHRRPKNKQDHEQTPQNKSKQYSNMTRAQSIGETPIYENFKVQTSNHTSTVEDMGREPEEDLYLQCDTLDDTIYSNDPACSLAMLPDPRDDDVYIMPDDV
ncbi:uncharacterized protein ACJ7VT_017376 [Polymixia lowei]